MTTLNDVLAIRDRIHTFEKECDEAEYTDTGEAWVLLNDTVRELNELASEIQHTSTLIEDARERVECPGVLSQKRHRSEIAGFLNKALATLKAT